MKKVYAFDFDGTLTTKDTLLEFIRFAKGRSDSILIGKPSRRCSLTSLKG